MSTLRFRLRRDVLDEGTPIGGALRKGEVKFYEPLLVLKQQSFHFVETRVRMHELRSLWWKSASKLTRNRCQITYAPQQQHKLIKQQNKLNQRVYLITKWNCFIEFYLSWESVQGLVVVMFLNLKRSHNFNILVRFMCYNWRVLQWFYIGLFKHVHELKTNQKRVRITQAIQTDSTDSPWKLNSKVMESNNIIRRIKFIQRKERQRKGR